MVLLLLFFVTYRYRIFFLVSRQNESCPFSLVFMYKWMPIHTCELIFFIVALMLQNKKKSSVLVQRIIHSIRQVFLKIIIIWLGGVFCLLYDFLFACPKRQKVLVSYNVLAPFWCSTFIAIPPLIFLLVPFVRAKILIVESLWKCYTKKVLHCNRDNPNVSEDSDPPISTVVVATACSRNHIFVWILSFRFHTAFA